LTTKYKNEKLHLEELVEMKNHALIEIEEKDKELQEAQ